MIKVGLESEDEVRPYCLISGATTNSTLVYGSNCLLMGWACTNTNAANRYVKLYNLPNPPIVGTDSTSNVIMLPLGGGNNYSSCKPILYSRGLALAITTGAADTDTGAVAAGEIIVNLFFKIGIIA